PLQPQPEPAPNAARGLEDSRLLGATVAPAGFADVAEKDVNSSVPNSEVAVVEGAVLKRKRGRPAKGAPKVVPVVRQKKDEEDVGIYVAPVKRLRIICAILARTLCARGAQKTLILFVSERIKVCAEYA
ncbi:hypothetical protein V8G54_016463, partial [Vigna mungo]